ncbi:MAG: Hsp33 family molecular chaperone HslO [Bdellovibrionales bacterium]|jgi:molecular chaperone Hsp33
MNDVNEKKLAKPLAWIDAVLPFQLEGSALRGRFVRLGGSIDTILRQHDYPLPVARLLAEMTALAAALGTAMKYEGVFTIQTKTDGAVRMMVADVTSDGAVRAYAQFDEAAVAEASAKEGGSLLGRGHLVLTLDQKLGEERYQGVVQVEGDDLTQAFQLYFKQSEQIPTGLVVAAHRDEAGVWQAGCLMIQRMPREGGLAVMPATDTAIEDDWLRAMALMQTCSPDELTDPSLAAPDLLFRLFHEEGVRVYEPLALRHECRCSRDKIAGVLEGMPPDELKAMAQDEGHIAATCQFCSKTYRFGVDELAAPEPVQPSA